MPGLAVGLHSAQDGSSDDARDRTVTRHEIEQTHFRGVEREDAGGRACTEKCVGTNKAAAKQQWNRREETLCDRSALGA